MHFSEVAFMISPQGERMENLASDDIWLHVLGQFCAEVLKSLLNAFTPIKNAPVEL